MRYHTLSLIVLSGFATSALGQIGLSPDQSILSAFQDTSNLFMSTTGYGAGLFHSGADPDTYINGLEFAVGPGWDPDLDLYYSTSEFHYNGSETYALGTPISGDQWWHLDSLVSRAGPTIDVDAGVYDFEYRFYGGGDALANDLLGTLQYQIEVFPRLELEVSGVATPNVVGVGDHTMVSMTVHNLMASRDFVATTWFITGGDWWSNMDFEWRGSWWGKVVAPGDSLTDDHTEWTVRPDTAPGDYVGNFGVVGGLYNGDWHWIKMDPQPTLHVVPEPTSLAVIGVGLLALWRKSRK